MHRTVSRALAWVMPSLVMGCMAPLAFVEPGAPNAGPAEAPTLYGP